MAVHDPIRSSPARRAFRRTRCPLAVPALLLSLAALLGLASCGDGEKADTGVSAPQQGSGRGTRSTTSDANPTPGDQSTDTEPVTTATPPSGDTKVAVQVEKVATLESPTMLRARPGDTGHLYASERAGHLRRLTVGSGGKLSVDDVDLLDLSKQTTTDSERGLLSFDFAPDGKTIYVSYTNIDGNTRVASYAMNGDKVDAKSAKVLLSQDQPFSNHNGGNVVVGPDEMLWFGFGDGGAGDDPGQRAQDSSTNLGKIVRIDPSGGKPEIVVHGVRNPWRYSFDTDGSLWIGDVGQNQWEEIDRIPAEKIDGANLGWSGREGTHPNSGVPDSERGARTGKDPIDPVFDYSHDNANCSITGGFVYRGKAIPALDGAYLFADYCAGSLRAVTVGTDNKLAKELDLGVKVEQPISFGSDADGEAYVLTQGGDVLRIVTA